VVRLEVVVSEHIVGRRLCLILLYTPGGAADSQRSATNAATATASHPSVSRNAVFAARVWAESARRPRETVTVPPQFKGDVGGYIPSSIS